MDKNEEIISLHRRLAAEVLHAEQGWARAEAKSKECIELRERMAGAQNAEAIRNQAWQPIETAPQDGSAVLLSRVDAGGSWIGKYDPVYPSGYRPENPWFSLMLNRDYLPKPLKSSSPTHWMPLPEAPALQTGSANTQEGGNHE